MSADRSKENKDPSTLEEALKTISVLLDEWFGEHIDEREANG
jgi:predicted RNase H-like HicB family nuclease